MSARIRKRALDIISNTSAIDTVAPLHVDNDGDVYSVDAEVFARTYRATGPGTFVKTTPIWAEKAQAPGSVKTKEGVTHFEAGDYLVSNSSDGSDQYAISAAKFEALYMLDMDS